MTILSRGDKLIVVFNIVSRCNVLYQLYTSHYWHCFVMLYFVRIIGFLWTWTITIRHNGCAGVSNQQSHDCLLNRLFRRISKKTSKLRIFGLCVGYSSGTGEFHAQMASQRGKYFPLMKSSCNEFTYIPKYCLNDTGAYCWQGYGCNI